MASAAEGAQDIQVLVAGAGPVGLALAANLARLGIGVRIVDRTAERTDKSKALVVWCRTLELMEIMGCAERFIAAGMKVTRANIFARGRRLARMTLDAIESAHRYALFIPQSETERLLDEHLNGLGVTVERRVELTGFEQDRDGVTATLAHADGQAETVRAQWLVGCDGAHSTVRHKLGFAFEGETEQSDWILADVHLQGPAAEKPELSIFWHPEGVLVLFPITPGRFRVVGDMGTVPAATPGQATSQAELTLPEVQALLDRRGPGNLTARDPVWLSRFRINERKVANYRSGRVFLAGDAAHIHSPAGGQGMNTGIQDACNLAWKLALGCRGLARGEALLDSYTPERSAVGEMVLRNATRLTRVAIMRNPLGQAVRNTILSVVAHFPAFRRRFAATLAEIDIAYPDSPLSRAGGGAGVVPPGARMPDCAVRRLDGMPTTLHALLREGRLALLAGSEAQRAKLAELVARHPGALTAAVSEGLGSGLMIVRPDAYAGLVTGPDDWSGVGSYLDAFLTAG
jgi:2-polyprenyl-6-methoxyphenol hydroxylase-like FAD-dependent oxidoreductase